MRQRWIPELQNEFCRAEILTSGLPGPLLWEPGDLYFRVQRKAEQRSLERDGVHGECRKVAECDRVVMESSRVKTELH